MHFVYLCRTHFVLLVENFTENSYRGIITDLVRLKRITRAILLPFWKGLQMIESWYPYDTMKWNNQRNMMPNLFVSDLYEIQMYQMLCMIKWEKGLSLYCISLVCIFLPWSSYPIKSMIISFFCFWIDLKYPM